MDDAMTTRAREVEALRELEAWLRKRERRCRDEAVELAESGEQSNSLAWRECADTYAARASALSALIAECEEARELLKPFAEAALPNDRRDDGALIPVAITGGMKMHFVALGAFRAARAFIAKHTQPVLRCTGCGSTATLEEIRAKHPGAIACCPERDMRPVPQMIRASGPRDNAP